MNSSILEIVTAEIYFLPCFSKNKILMRKVLKMTRTASTATCHLIFTS